MQALLRPYQDSIKTLSKLYQGSIKGSIKARSRLDQDSIKTPLRLQHNRSDTALHAAARFGQLAAVEWLLARGARAQVEPEYSLNTALIQP